MSELNNVPDGVSTHDRVSAQAGLTHRYLIYEPFLGQIGSNFQGIKYIYGIASSEVGKGTCEMLQKLWLENTCLDSSRFSRKLYAEDNVRKAVDGSDSCFQLVEKA